MTAGVARICFTVACSFSTTAGGVFAGAASMCHAATSKPFSPASSTDGRSGCETSRLAVDTAIARTRPASIIGATGGTSQNISEMCPATTSFSAGRLPR